MNLYGHPEVETRPDRYVRNHDKNHRLVVLGLNYHSTPLEIRERFVIPASCLHHALNSLSQLPHLEQSAILSTCNRTEVYAVVKDLKAGLNELEAFFLSTQTIGSHDVLKPNFKLLDEDAAIHLFRVASGLDSLILGEGQIMSQVKASNQATLDAGTSGPIIDHLFKFALQCGKRVRSETSIAKRAVSVSSAAVELALELLGKLGNLSITVIGAGAMGQICLKHLLSEDGTGPVALINRSPKKLQGIAQNQLSNHHRLRTNLDFSQRHQVVANSDLIIVSTSAPHHLITTEELSVLDRSRDIVIIDISVPRNVDPGVSNLKGVRLFHADNLATIVDKNLSERQALVSKAEDIVFQTLEAFHAWQRSLIVAPTITGLRQKFESIRQEQVQNTRYNVEPRPEAAEYIERISRSILNQILHHPTLQLKEIGNSAILKQQAQLLHSLFDLDPRS